MGGFFDYLRMMLGWYSAPVQTSTVNPLYSSVFYSRVVGLDEWYDHE